MNSKAPGTLEHWLKISGVALTLVGLLAGTYQFARNQAVEAAHPFLERKLKWCEEAVEVAAGAAPDYRWIRPPNSKPSFSRWAAGYRESHAA